MYVYLLRAWNNTMANKQQMYFLLTFPVYIVHLIASSKDGMRCGLQQKIHHIIFVFLAERSLYIVRIDSQHTIWSIKHAVKSYIVTTINISSPPIAASNCAVHVFMCDVWSPAAALHVYVYKRYEYKSQTRTSSTTFFGFGNAGQDANPNHCSLASII